MDSRRTRNTPVTAFRINPTEIKFHLEDGDNCQTVTLFNPLEFPVKYSFFTPDMEKFIIEPPGLGLPFIEPRSCAQISVKLANPVTMRGNSKDLFMVILSDIHTRGVIAKKFFIATVESSSCGDKSKNQNNKEKNQAAEATRGKEDRNERKQKEQINLNVIAPEVVETDRENTSSMSMTAFFLMYFFALMLVEFLLFTFM